MKSNCKAGAGELGMPRHEFDCFTHVEGRLAQKCGTTNGSGDDGSILKRAWLRRMYSSWVYLN